MSSIPTSHHLQETLTPVLLAEGMAACTSSREAVWQRISHVLIDKPLRVHAG